MRRFLVLILIPILAGYVGAASDPAADETDPQESPATDIEEKIENQEEPESPGAVYIITVHDMVDRGLEKSITRRVGLVRQLAAEQAKPVIIIFDVDTFGGRLDSAFEISDFVNSIDDMNAPTSLKDLTLTPDAICIANPEFIGKKPDLPPNWRTV